MNILILGYIIVVLLAFYVLRASRVSLGISLFMALTSPISFPAFALAIVWFTRDEKRD